MPTNRDISTLEDFLDWWEIKTNPEQREFIASVHKKEEHAVGIAVPGSGKTTCIVTMVHYLNQHHKVSLDKIQVCSFNADAAELIRKRLGALGGGSEQRFWRTSRTYHSVGFEVCKKIGRTELVADRGELLMRAIDLHKKRFGPLRVSSDLKDVELLITFTKNRGGYVLDPTNIDSSAFIPNEVADYFDVDKMSVQTLLVCYEHEKGKMIDFDDQIVIPSMLYRNGQNPFDHMKKLEYLLLDELQDANRAQMMMAKAIHDISGCKVIGVGDKDQSIYSWRGASVENIDAFIKEFKARSFPISHNYRSGGQILKAAASILRHNEGREGYEIGHGRKKVRGEVIEVNCFNESQEHSALIHIVKSLESCPDFPGGPFRKDRITIIARTNNALSSAARTLFSAGIMVICRSDDLNGEFAQLLNSVAAVLTHPNANMRDVLRSVKGVGKMRAEAMTMQGIDLEEVDVSAVGRGKIANRVSRFIDKLRSIQVKGEQADVVYNDLKSFEKIIAVVRDQLSALVEEYAESTAIAVRSELNSAASFMMSLAEQRGPRGTINMLYEMGDIDLTADRNDAVELMTAHKSKGQENDAVIIIGADNFPAVYADKEREDYSQETNLLFVAATRARDVLIVMRRPQFVSKKVFDPMASSGEMIKVESPLYANIEWDRSVSADPLRKEDFESFLDCFPIHKPQAHQPKKKRSFEEVDWPSPVKEFVTGKDLESFKAHVAGKFQDEGCRTYLHMPSSKKTFYLETSPSEMIEKLRITAKPMMNKAIKDENERTEKQHLWLTSASKFASDFLGDGWSPDVYQMRRFLRSVAVQRDVVISLSEPEENKRSSETFLVCSLRFEITGHPRVRVYVKLLVSRVKFSLSPTAQTIQSFMRVDAIPVTGPVGMILWRSDMDWSKSIQPKEGYHSAIEHAFERREEIQALVPEFDKFVGSTRPEDAKPLMFHPGGHLWVHRDIDCLWPIHPRDVVLVDHPETRYRPVFDLSTMQAENAFYESFKLGDQAMPFSQFEDHVSEVKKSYRMLSASSWEVVVASAFNVPKGCVMGEGIGKRMMFTIESHPDMTFPEASFLDEVKRAMGRDVKFKIG